MTEIQFTEKFIGFVDILGWKFLVRRAAAGQGLTLGELSEILTALGAAAYPGLIDRSGPPMCSSAPRIASDIDLRISSVSDCVIVSAEISPAGIASLVSHCWAVCMKLLSKGIMCRGYIARGRIYHTAEHQMGPGLNDVVDREREVSIFRERPEERGTPFIEISGDVVRYVERQRDRYVKEMFFRLVQMEGDVAAIFPFQVLDCRCSPQRRGARHGFGQEPAAPNGARCPIRRIREQIDRHIDPSDREARRMRHYYVRMLDAQHELRREIFRD